MACRTAEALAARAGRTHVTDDDLGPSRAPVYAHRATQMPSDEAAPEDPPAPEDSPQTDMSDGAQELTELAKDLIVEAVAAQLPPDILAGLPARQKSQQHKSGHAG